MGAQGLQIACMNIPFVQKVLHMNPVSFKEWACMLGLSLITLFVMEIFKIIYERVYGREEKMDSAD